MKLFKLAFIGGGLNSVVGYTHFVASQMDGNFKVVSGVFSRNPQTNEETAKYWNIERFYSNIDDLIEEEKDRVDAFVVLLPTPDHYKVIKKLLLKGLPVITDKPLFSDYESFIKLQKEVPNLEDLFLVITYNYLGYPMVQELRNLIKEGFFGRILNVHLEMPQESFLRPPKNIDYPPKWRKFDPPIPGIMLDLATHLLAFAQYLLEEDRIKTVWGNFYKYSPFGVVDEAKFLLEFESGATGLLWVSKVALGNRNGLKISIYGERASAIWVQQNPEILEINTSKGEKLLLDRSYEGFKLSKGRIFNRMTPGHPAGYIEAFANIYNEIYKALKLYKEGKNYKNNPLIWTFEKEFKTFKVLKAMVGSANGERKVSVEW